ncbi:MAG TPA: 2-oxo-4-hydroxy-4-carboxy-5-ureidoimidazoline decarboxylase [Thermoanaerobaculia bacterium]
MTGGLDKFNALSPEEAEAQLRRCGGSGQWARAMSAERPFPTPEAAWEAADRAWNGLDREGWLEAFRSHPRIGDRRVSGREAEEQAGASSASQQVSDALARGNRAYEERFGHIYIVFASGKSAEEMLRLLEERLGNDPDTELAAAAAEHRKITRLRLEKLLA